MNRERNRNRRGLNTDLGNARQLVARHGRDLRFCPKWNKWVFWDGNRWRIDETGEVERRAKETVVAIRNVRHAKQSQSASRIRGMIFLARTEPGIPIGVDELDRDPNLFNCLNGTLDLRTGQLRDSRREDLLTKLARVNYNPKATCPIFEEFLARIMGNNEELIAYVQRCFGYALTGAVSEKAVFILHGSGDNGKTTLLEAIRHVLGDYAGQIPIESLMTRRSDGGVPNDIAGLNGRRFVTSSEGEQGKALAEAKLKLITGMGKLTARYLFQEYFEFDPTFKLFIDSNHKPEVRGTDNAIWNRLKLIPFNVSIPKAEQDKHLLEKLRTEAPGILAWAVRGCLEWQRNGLGEPSCVEAASKAYREEMDTVAEFVESECVLEAGLHATSDAIHSAYFLWCQEAGAEPLGKKVVGTRLHEMGLESGKVGGQRAWKGIGLKTQSIRAA